MLSNQLMAEEVGLAHRAWWNLDTGISIIGPQPWETPKVSLEFAQELAISTAQAALQHTMPIKNRRTTIRASKASR